MEQGQSAQVLSLFPKSRIYNYPCVLEDSLAPNEVEATLHFGARIIYILAPITKVYRSKQTIQLSIIGRVGDSDLVSLPGEVENGTSTITVESSVLDLHDL